MANSTLCSSILVANAGLVGADQDRRVWVLVSGAVNYQLLLLLPICGCDPKKRRYMV